MNHKRPSINESIISQYLPLSEKKCRFYGLETGNLYSGRIMQGIFYALDKEDFNEKVDRGLKAIEKEAHERFLVSSTHLVNIVRQKLVKLRVNVDYEHDWRIIHQLSNYLVHKGILLDFPVLSDSDLDNREFSEDSEGNTRTIYFIRYHKEHKSHVKAAMKQTLSYVHDNNVNALQHLRVILKSKGIVPLELAQRDPEDWDRKILLHLQFAGFLQYPVDHLKERVNSEIITPSGIFN